MTVDKLIEEYEWSKRKKGNYDFGKHIIKKYMPYAEKCALVKSVIDNSSYIDIEGKRIYRRSTSTAIFIFTMKLIEYYTDVEMGDVTKDYDALMESSAMNGLMTQIPQEETDILRGMLEMERDDLECNTRSLISYFESKTESIHFAMESFISALEKMNKIDVQE